jgi:integrase
MLNTLHGVLKTAWRLALISGDDYQQAIDFDGVRGETLPAGRKLSRDEIMALVQDCEKDPTNAGVRCAAIIAMAYSCGLRRVEIIALDFDYNDSESGRLVDSPYQTGYVSASIKIA